MTEFPESPEAEKAVLGCVLLDPVLAADLRLDWFHDLGRREIAENLLAMTTAGEPVDSLTLIQRLTDSKRIDPVGGVATIGALPEATASPGQFGHFKKKLEEKLILRTINITCANAAHAALEPNPDVPSLLEKLESDIFALGTETAEDGPTITADLREITEDWERAAAEPGKLRGIAVALRIEVGAWDCAVRQRF